MKNEAKTFSEILKFNPYHDRLGRFATGGGFMNSAWNGPADKQARTFSANPKTKAGAMAIERESALSHETIGRAYENPKFTPKEAPKKKPQTDRKTPDKKQKDADTKQQSNSNMPSSTNNKSGLPDNVINKCREIEAKTVNRKTEKMSLVNEDGFVIAEKSGSKGRVSFGADIGIKMDERTTLTHNHPGEFGGTFSGADIEVFCDYRLKAIRAVGKEGTYSLERTEKSNSNGSYELKTEFKKRSNSLNRQIRSDYNALKSKVMRGEITPDEANSTLSDKRTKLCNEQHEYLKKVATSYGFRYVYEPSTGGVSKMFSEILKAKDEEEQNENPSGEITLDGEFMSGDNWMIK